MNSDEDVFELTDLELKSIALVEENPDPNCKIDIIHE